MEGVAIEFIGVSYRYPQMDRWAIQDFSLAVPRNCFMVLAGPTGSGKSTLLRIARGMHQEYGGEFRGTVSVLGSRQEDVSALGSKVAIVFQNPSYQLHQPRVIDELMSSPIYQGLPWQECLARAQHGADEILKGRYLERNPTDLSLGEQQTVALAASISMDAEIVLLDEPFSYLDSRASQDFMQVLLRMHASGKTIVLSTHNLEPVAALADAIALMSNGALVDWGTPAAVLYGSRLQTVLGQPLFVKAGARLQGKTSPGRLILSWADILSLRTPRRETVQVHWRNQESRKSSDETPVVEVSHASYRYPNGNVGIEDVSLTINDREVFGIVGGNGSGKTTLARVILNLLRPSRGGVKILGEEVGKTSYNLASKVGYVIQNPSEMIFETTVDRECSFGPRALGLSSSASRVHATLSGLGLTPYIHRDPHSLSGGEQRLLTIADVLVNDPVVLILDEPEFGLDPKCWDSVKGVIRRLRAEKRTVVLITQRLEATLFLCDRVALMKDGQIMAVGEAPAVLTDQALVEAAGLFYLPVLRVFANTIGKSKTPVDEEQFVESIMSRYSE